MVDENDIEWSATILGEAANDWVIVGVGTEQGKATRPDGLKGCWYMQKK